MNYIDLGHRVRSLRKKQNLTQEQLAERIDVSASFMGHIERGSRVASLETLVKLCDALDTSPDYLLSASIAANSVNMPHGLTQEMKERLSEFLFLAYEIVMNTPTD